MDNEIIGVIIVVAVILFMSIENNNKVLRADISRINKKLEKIAKQIGVPDDDEKCNMDNELRNIIAENGKIKAIKKYREVTGIGLKEAKEYVDNLK